MSKVIEFAAVRKTVTMNASPKRVFATFATGQWWPKEHSILKSPRRELVLEPRAGGRWYERGEDGSECDWGKVLSWEPPERIVLVWSLNGRFEYDPGLLTEVEVRFVAIEGGKTRVELEHRHIENAGDTAQALRDGVDSPNGWGLMLGHLREAAEADRGAPAA